MCSNVRHVHVPVDVTNIQIIFTYFVFAYTVEIVHQIVSHSNRANDRL
jgi:hypothetical protein